MTTPTYLSTNAEFQIFKGLQMRRRELFSRWLAISAVCGKWDNLIADDIIAVNDALLYIQSTGNIDFRIWDETDEVDHYQD